MAKQKLAIQNGQDEIFEDETETKFKTTDDDKVALAAAYKYYSELETHIDWSYPDYLRCRELLNKALTFNNGEYNPMKSNILSPEQKFDVELEEPWAYYDYGNGDKGYLRIKGTIDLIVRDSLGNITCVDYKTGKIYDWAKDKEKTFQSLHDDYQLLLYYYICKKLYPDEDVYFTIYYIDFDKPITLMFDEADIAKAKELTKKRFLKIKNLQNPRPARSWKCEKLCHYGRFSLDGTKIVGYNGSMCDQMNKELKQVGLEKLFQKHAKDKNFEQYTGGGRSNKPSTDEPVRGTASNAIVVDKRQDI